MKASPRRSPKRPGKPHHGLCTVGLCNNSTTVPLGPRASPSSLSKRDPRISKASEAEDFFY